MALAALGWFGASVCAGVAGKVLACSKCCRALTAAILALIMHTTDVIPENTPMFGYITANTALVLPWETTLQHYNLTVNIHLPLLPSILLALVMHTTDMSREMTLACAYCTANTALVLAWTSRLQHYNLTVHIHLPFLPSIIPRCDGFLHGVPHTVLLDFMMM